MEIHKAAYRWTNEESVAAMRGHQNAFMRPSIVRAAGVLAVLLAVPIWGEWLCRGWLSDYWLLNMTAASAYSAFPIYWTLLRRPLWDRQLRRGFRDLEDDQMIEWEVSAQEVKYLQRGLFYAAVPWKNLVMVNEVRDGFLFYTHPESFVWLPFRAFDGPEAPERVREFVRQSGVAYRKISS